MKNSNIVYVVRRQLSWTHLRSLMSVEDELARKFYMEICRSEHWNTRTLDEKIDSQLYERTVISSRLEEVIKAELDTFKASDRLHPDLVFRSSYFLDLAELPDVFSASVLDPAILNQIQQFLNYTKLPDKKLLSEKLQRAIAIAKKYQRNKEKDD